MANFGLRIFTATNHELPRSRGIASAAARAGLGEIPVDIAAMKNSAELDDPTALVNDQANTIVADPDFVTVAVASEPLNAAAQEGIMLNGFAKRDFLDSPAKFGWHACQFPIEGAVVDDFPTVAHAPASRRCCSYTARPSAAESLSSPWTS